MSKVAKKKAVKVDRESDTKCPYCHGYFNGIKGLNIHQRTCKDKKAYDDDIAAAEEEERLKRKAVKKAAKEAAAAAAAAVTEADIEDSSSDEESSDDTDIQTLSYEVQTLNAAVADLTTIVKELQLQLQQAPARQTLADSEEDDDLTTFTRASTMSHKSTMSHTSHSPMSKYGGTPSVSGKSYRNKPYGEICLSHDPDTEETVWADVYKTDRNSIYYIRNGDGGKKYITDNAKMLKQVVLNPNYNA